MQIRETFLGSSVPVMETFLVCTCMLLFVKMSTFLLKSPYTHILLVNLLSYYIPDSVTKGRIARASVERAELDHVVHEAHDRPRPRSPVLQFP